MEYRAVSGRRFHSERSDLEGISGSTMGSTRGGEERSNSCRMELNSLVCFLAGIIKKTYLAQLHDS